MFMPSAFRGCCLAVVLVLLVPTRGQAEQPPAASQNEAPAEAMPSAVSGTPLEPGATSGPSVLTLLATGAMGEAVLFFPLTLTGAFVGAFVKEPCSEHCDGVTYWRAGAVVGGSLGVALGAGGGMMLMDAAYGRRANAWATLGGAALGSTLGMVVLLSSVDLMNTGFDEPLPLLLPPVGALVGALVGHQLAGTELASGPFSLNETQVTLMLGGATLGSALGIAGVFLINDFFYFPTPFLLEDQPWRFLLPPAGALLGAGAGYLLAPKGAGASTRGATTEAGQVRIISGVAPLPGGGMISLLGRF